MSLFSFVEHETNLYVMNVIPPVRSPPVYSQWMMVVTHTAHYMLWVGALTADACHFGSRISMSEKSVMFIKVGRLLIFLTGLRSHSFVILKHTTEFLEFDPIVSLCFDLTVYWQPVSQPLLFTSSFKNTGHIILLTLWTVIVQQWKGEGGGAIDHTFPLRFFV